MHDSGTSHDKLFFKKILMALQFKQIKKFSCPKFCGIFFSIYWHNRNLIFILRVPLQFLLNLVIHMMFLNSLAMHEPYLTRSRSILCSLFFKFYIKKSCARESVTHDHGHTVTFSNKNDIKNKK